MSNLPKATGKSKRGNRGMGRLYKKANGKIYPADSKAKGNYYLQYTVNGKRIATVLKDADGNNITDRDQAEAERKRILAPFAAGDQVEALKAITAKLADAEERQALAIETAADAIKLKDAWELYEASTERPQAGDATLHQYSFQWARFEKWMKENKPDMQALRSVSTQAAREYYNDLSGAGLSQGTVNKHTALLRLVFSVVNTKPTTDGNYETLPNPFANIRAKKHKQKSRRELTTEELRRIIDLASGETKLLLALGIYTGLRMGDCCTLKWDEVEFARNRILRIPNKTADNEKAVSVPLFHTLRDMLLDAAQTSKGIYVLPEAAETYTSRSTAITDRIQRLFWRAGIDCHAPGTGEQIKRDDKGNPIRNSGGNVVLESTGKRAVVQCGFHSLRHTFVSLCSNAHAPASVVQAIVGHSNPAMTRHYDHPSQLEAAKAIAQLPDFTTDADTPPQREPLPSWARDLVEGMNGKTWKQIKQQLLKGGAK